MEQRQVRIIPYNRDDRSVRVMLYRAFEKQDALRKVIHLQSNEIDLLKRKLVRVQNSLERTISSINSDEQIQNYMVIKHFGFLN